MPRTSQWARRALGLGVAATLGLFGAFLLAAPASAHDAAATAEMSCQQDGSVLVTWTIKNDYKLAADISNLSGSPVSANAASTHLDPYGSTTATQTVDASATQASLTYHVTWTDGFSLDKDPKVSIPAGTCQAQSSPSPSEAAPVPSPSVTDVAESPSATVAPASSSPAASLPVTGTSLTAIIAAAVALIGGGVALFVIARRRRA